MNRQDVLWKELKDDWTGRMYQPRNEIDSADAIYVIDDDGDAITYRRSILLTSPLFCVGKTIISDNVKSGLLIRIR